MTARRHQDPDWREFEQLVTRIEADAGPQELRFKPLDRIRCRTNRQLR